MRIDSSNIIQLITFTVTLVIIIALLLRECSIIKDVKNTFNCKYCGSLNNSISNGHKCTECNRVFSNISKYWDHTILFRVSSIDTSIKKQTYNYKDYIKLPITCIIIYSAFSIILLAEIIILLV